jgi:UPF0716 protein FxsA
MILVVLVFLLSWPVVELLVAIAVAGAIGIAETLLLLVLVSVVGAALLKRSGLSVWRRANAEVAAGRAPTRQVIDGALVLVGGLGLVLPGFVSGAVGALLMLPPVRALLRPALIAWMGSRAARATRSGRLSGMVVNTVVESDGSVRRRSRSFGEVIDTEGWDVGPSDPRPLPPGVIDVEGEQRDR